MFNLVQAVLALYAALIFCSAMIVLFMLFLDVLSPSRLALQMYRELVALIDRYSVMDDWPHLAEKQKTKATSIRKRLASLEKGAPSRDEILIHDRVSAALVWGRARAG